MCNEARGGGLFVERNAKWFLIGVSLFKNGPMEMKNNCHLEKSLEFIHVGKYKEWIKDNLVDSMTLVSILD